MEKITACVIGSGNWGTAMAKIMAENAAVLPEFDERVHIFVYDELFEGKCVCDIINTKHVNSKYLPGVELPENLMAHTDLVEAAKHADIIVFAMPQHFIADFCKSLLGKIKPNATAISLLKGFTSVPGGGIELISKTVKKFLKIPCSVLVGVNLATEITHNRYCEVTIGCRDQEYSKLFRDLFTTKNFRTTVIDDADCVEVCGFIKDLVAFACGILDGLEANENTKSACLRFHIIETIRFLDIFYPGSKVSTLLESCGIADMLTVSFGSKNRHLAEALAKTDRSLELLECQLFGGVKQFGPLVAKEVNYMLQNKKIEFKFPLFTVIHKICQKEARPQDLLKVIATIPNIIYHPTNLIPI